MPNTIKLERTSINTTEIINPILIDETSTTRRVLYATIVDNPKDADACISGAIVHQRKSKSKEWESADTIKLSTLKSGEGVKMEFSCREMKNLREALLKAYTIGHKGVQPSGKYIFGKEDEFIIAEGREKECIQALLSKNLGEEIWDQLVAEQSDLATKLSLAKIQMDRTKIVQQFESMKSDETMDEKKWQQFFSENDWIFGYGLSYIFTSLTNREVYLGGKNIHNSGGSVSDFMATSQGDARYSVLVEIKRPTTQLLGPEDRNNSYPISQDFAKALAQIQCYRQTWGENSTRELTEYELSNNLTHTTPKGIVLIGDTSQLTNSAQKKAFELFRRDILNVEIITYDELLARARFMTNTD